MSKNAKTFCDKRAWQWSAWLWLWLNLCSHLSSHLSAVADRSARSLCKQQHAGDEQGQQGGSWCCGQRVGDDALTRWPWLWGRRVQVSCCSAHGSGQGQCDVAGVGDAQGGLQEDGVHHQTMSVKLHQSLICALLGLGTCGSCSSLSIHFDQLNVCTV